MTQYYYPYLATNVVDTMVINDLTRPASNSRIFRFELPPNFPAQFSPVSQFPPLTLDMTYEPTTLTFRVRGMTFTSDLMANISLLANNGEGYSVSGDGVRAFEIKFRFAAGFVAIYRFFFTVTTNPETGIRSLAITINTRSRSASILDPNLPAVNLTRLETPFIRLNL